MVLNLAVSDLGAHFHAIHAHSGRVLTLSRVPGAASVGIKGPKTAEMPIAGSTMVGTTTDGAHLASSLHLLLAGNILRCHFQPHA